MLIVLTLALLVGCTEVAEDSENNNNENNTTQESGNNQTGGNNNNNDNTEPDYPDYPDEPDEPAYLSAPTLTSASYSETTGKISLSWSRVSNCEYYEIYYSTTGTSKTYLDYETSTSATITVKNEDVTFYFWIKAVNSSTSSDYSNYKTVYIPASWTPPTVYDEIEGTGTDYAIVKNLRAGILIGLDFMRLNQVTRIHIQQVFLIWIAAMTHSQVMLSEIFIMKQGIYLPVLLITELLVLLVRIFLANIFT